MLVHWRSRLAVKVLPQLSPANVWEFADTSLLELELLSTHIVYVDVFLLYLVPEFPGTRGVIGECAHGPSFFKTKRKSGKARESQAIADCFFSRVTNFFLNREKTFDKPRKNVSILKELFVLLAK